MIVQKFLLSRFGSVTVIHFLCRLLCFAGIELISIEITLRNYDAQDECIPYLYAVDFGKYGLLVQLPILSCRSKQYTLRYKGSKHLSIVAGVIGIFSVFGIRYRYIPIPKMFRYFGICTDTEYRNTTISVFFRYL